MLRKALVCAALLAPLSILHAEQVTPAAGTAAQAASIPKVGFSIIRTGSRPVREALVFAGGSFAKEVDTIFSAFLIKHGDDLILLDTGLGSRISSQYQADMPLWSRPLFTYPDPVSPVREQLDRAGIGPIRKIILSHAHWDHASGLPDFPEAEVSVSSEEVEEIHDAGSGAGRAWPSQVGSTAIKWRPLSFRDAPYEGFEKSLDLYGDGAVVLVPLFGHSHGSVGLFLTADSGRKYFFVGDVIWNTGALREAAGKFVLARMIVDRDADKTQLEIKRIAALAKANPNLVIVPAHDGGLQKSLGFFPAWVR